ncbi:hypothetical protein Taro_050168 [Colocasia esculenta]|uniref:Uncharacterized protein n=1 Tax=Colocasia esculenta TaxID=4460 RepID=A0A843XD48_COLES|nr:hypothetical protein [Colocasia esculenta]
MRFLALDFLQENLNACMRDACSPHGTRRQGRREALAPRPAEEQEDQNPNLCPLKKKATNRLLRPRRRRSTGCPPQRCPLSRPHTPCVRLEHSLEGLRKSPLIVDSHMAAGLDCLFRKLGVRLS